MNKDLQPIEELRREIDLIDDGLHDLLMKRTRVVEQIRLLKADNTDPVFLRPGREAQVIRRLLLRHQGRFPKTVIATLWREIISTFTALQGPFVVAICKREENSAGFPELAREHYGTYPQIVIHRSEGQVIRAVADRQATVGILPVPSEDSTTHWWTSLMGTQADLPRVAVRLPFVARHNRNAEAIVIARVAQEDTGGDRSWLGIDTQSDISRARLISSLKSAGFENVNFLDAYNNDGTLLALMEVSGCLKADDPRLTHLMQQDKIAHKIVILGGYASPLSPEQLQQ